MSMKHVKYAAMIAAIAFASCQVQDEPEVTFSREMTFTAMSGEEETRTQIDQSDNTKILWTPNDAIKVFYGAKATGKFAFNGKEAASIATFTGSFNSLTGGVELDPGTESYWAVYPYQDGSKFTGEGVTLSVPSVQTAVKGSFQNGAFPSVAVSNRPSLPFYNVCGGVCLKVSRSDINQIVFTGKNNEDLVGNVEVTMSNGRPSAKVVKGEKSITLNGKLVAGANYYVSMLPQELASGVTVTFYTTSGLKGSCELGSTTIERSLFKLLENPDNLVKVWSKTAWVGDIAGSEAIEGGEGKVSSENGSLSYEAGTISWTANTTGKPRQSVLTLPNGGKYTLNQVEPKDLAGDYDFYNFSFKTTGVSTTTVINQNNREHRTAVKFVAVDDPQEINGHLHNLDLVGLYLDFKVPASFEVVDGVPVIHTYQSLNYQNVSNGTEMACIPQLTYTAGYNGNYFAEQSFGNENCNYFWGGWGLDDLFGNLKITIGTDAQRYVFYSSAYKKYLYFCGFSFVKKGYAKGAYTTIYQFNYKNKWVYSETGGGARFVRK